MKFIRLGDKYINRVGKVSRGDKFMGKLFSILVGCLALLLILGVSLRFSGGLLIVGILIALIGNYFSNDTDGEKWRVWLSIVLLSVSLGPLTTPLFCGFQDEQVALYRNSTPKEWFDTGNTVQSRWASGFKRNSACYDEGGLAWSIKNQPYRFILRIIILGYSLFLIHQFLGIRRSPALPPVTKNIRKSTFKTMTKKPTPGIGKTGREVILLRNGDASTDEEIFDFFYENMLDIVTREHLSKGDLDDWFARTARAYIAAYPQLNKKYEAQELVTRLKWAKSHISTMYRGTSAATGEKRDATLTDLIIQLENL